MEIVKAPGVLKNAKSPWIFLGGSIEMGKAEQWQIQVTEEFGRKKFNGTILNPRRDDWDASWEQKADNPQFREQVEWELEAQEEADVIIYYFSPGTKSPITLLELGLFSQDANVFVCCPDEFWRKGNVDIVCERYGIPMFDNLKSLVDEVCEFLDGSTWAEAFDA
jgi:hypothetical protein